MQTCFTNLVATFVWSLSQVTVFLYLLLNHLCPLTVCVAVFDNTRFTDCWLESNICIVT